MSLLPLLIQQLFDQRWHKIMLGVTDNRAKLWVDCQPVKSVQGFIESPLRERGHYDTQDGFLSIAQIADTRRGHQVRIARQFMMTVFQQMINFAFFFLFLFCPLVSTSCEYTIDERNFFYVCWGGKFLNFFVLILLSRDRI